MDSYHKDLSESDATDRFHRLRKCAVNGLGRIITSGDTTLHQDTSRMPLRILGSYALVYLLEGQGNYMDANGLHLSLVPGDLILLFPDVGHRYGPGVRQSWHEAWILFDGPAFDLWRDAGILDPAHPVHHLEPVEHWKRRIESILGLPQGPTSAPLLEFSRLQQFLAEAFVTSAVASLSLSDFRWGVNACSVLESEAGFSTPLPEIARQLRMSYSQFRKKFTRVNGMSPGQYRNQRILERASQYLQQTGLSCQEIADRLGFADEFHFSHRFKELTGHSPNAFRKILRHSSTATAPGNGTSFPILS